MKKPIYLDYNATTPILPEVAEAMQPFLTKYYGNPSSSHSYGVQTKQMVEKARQQVASLLECLPEEIVFTSGGTESNNYAIKGIALAKKEKGNHIITSQIEHPAVTEVCEYLKKWGFEISYIAVDEFGVIYLSELENAIKPETILITVMHANNEVGTIQPIAEISQIAKKHGIDFHSDGAQSVGKISTSVKDLGVGLFSIAGHKLYGPKGIGALYIKNGIQLEKQMHGAKQENDSRAGTENILEIAGLGKACDMAMINLRHNFKYLSKIRDRLEDGLVNKFKNNQVNGKDLIRINGHKEQRLPNTLSISFLGIEANKLLAAIESEVAASAGAACHSEGINVSATLNAMKVPLEYAMGTLRLSTGKLTTKEEIDKAVKVIFGAVNKLIKDQ
jgi:cysteine desulfurase